MATSKTIQVASPEKLIQEAKAQIVRARYFKTGKVDKYGKIVGFREYPEGRVPFEHQVHHYDEMGRVVFFEKYVKEYSKPSLRVFHYEDWRVIEGIWIDRYGNIDNYHRYHYDDATGLMIWRAEYTYEGKLYYSIRSKYDKDAQHIEDAWYDAEDKLVKRLEYENDASGEPLVQREFDAQGQLVGSLKFKYDKNGNVLERAWHNAKDQRMSRFVYSYDAREQLIKVELRGEKDKIEARQEFAYDNVGNVIAEKWFDQNNKLYKDLRFEGSDLPPEPPKLGTRKPASTALALKKPPARKS